MVMKSPDRSKRSPMKKYIIKETTLYSAFTRMEKNGYITSFQDQNTATGKRRTYYRITGKGRAYYQEKCEEWLLTQEVVEQFIRKGNGKWKLLEIIWKLCFLNLPNTPEVYKAKNELWQMMEDKYTELKNEGKSENEAVGTVIAEFGNLDELAEDLGIKQFVHQPRQEQTSNAVSLSMEDVRQFLREHSRHSYFVALSIFLIYPFCLLPDLFPGLLQILRCAAVMYLMHPGIILMFVFIAIGVGMLVYSNVCMGALENHLEEGNFPLLILPTTDYIHHEMEHYKSTHALLLTIGIMLCILSVVPPILLDAASSFAADTLEDCSAGFVLIFVAIGVFLIVISSMRMGGYRTLLHLNNQNTIGGNYVPEQQDRQQYHNSTLAAIMSVYWPTITCLYLIWSFLSFDWWITWIVWPIAAIVESLIKTSVKLMGGELS